MDGNRFFPVVNRYFLIPEEAVVGFNWDSSNGCDILLITISEVGGGRLLSRLKSAVGVPFLNGHVTDKQTPGPHKKVFNESSNSWVITHI